jgi:hypothetical protein
MNPAEIGRLETYLRKVLGSSGVSVRAKNKEDAELVAGGAVLAEITRDEDEGETSYFISMGVSRAKGAAKDAPIDPPERLRMQSELRAKLSAPALEVRPRPRKTDSAEVYVGEEFIGTLSREDAGDIGAFLTMSILDIDLDESA